MLSLSTSQPARHPEPLARAKKLTHLIFERQDLDLAEEFLVEFGLRIALRTERALYARGTDPSAYCYRVERGARARFIGFGVSVDSRDELLRLSAGPISESTHPGGGEEVSLTCPAGFAVEVVYGQHCPEALPRRGPLAFNQTGQTRRVNEGQRPDVAPPEVLRLGHVVLEVAQFQRASAWYTSHLGFVPSDVQVLPDGSPAVVFMRLDLGETPADHHTLALAQSFLDAYGHSAYELVDADALGMGQRVLREAGYKHAWGIGRHILGSQLFDYWCDPWGDKHEHYCDGDVFTADAPMGVHPLSRAAMSQWGPPMPASFTRPSFTVANLTSLARNLRQSPDLSLRKLRTLAKVFG
jgi:catechol 2,3-dioxygenase-like lactoylglutathione lyase family enzyme